MQSKLPNDWKTQVIFVFIILMMASLFFSRALLSISMGGIVLLSILTGNNRQQWRTFFSTPLLWGLTLLFIIPLVSWCWSEDQAAWAKVIRVKLPLLVLPVAFAGCWQLNERQWRWLLIIFLITITAGTCWSVSQYIISSEEILQAYLKAKTIPVPLEGDYVRFSWLVCTGIVFALMMTEMNVERKWKIMLWLLAAWFFLFLHLLAARTGLFAAYLFLFALAVYKLIKARKKIVSVMVFAIVIVLPVIAWFFFPTFQNRFKYLRYNFDFVKNSSYLPGATDGNRLFSIKAGWSIVKENPFGVGAGDLRQVTKDWYDKEVPGMLEIDKIYPSNEWLIYGGFAGWAGLLLFGIVMLLPFGIKNIRHRFYWCGFHATALFSFFVDTGLEVQFGVFLYVFITCCWWKWLQAQKQHLV